MAVPANLVYTQGTGSPPITADNLNTFTQQVTTLANARGFSGTQNQGIFLQGYSSANDGGQGNFVWVVGTGTDDGGVTTIVPSNNTAGYWSRVGNASAVSSPQTVTGSANAVLTAVNVTGIVLVRSGGTTPTDTFPAASAIVAATKGAQPGSMKDLLVINENSGTYSLSPGAGVTFVGNLSTGNFLVTTGNQRLFKIYYASASTITVYG